MARQRRFTSVYDRLRESFEENGPKLESIYDLVEEDLRKRFGLSSLEDLPEIVKVLAAKVRDLRRDIRGLDPRDPNDVKPILERALELEALYLEKLSLLARAEFMLSRALTSALGILPEEILFLSQQDFERSLSWSMPLSKIYHAAELVRSLNSQMKSIGRSFQGIQYLLTLYIQAAKESF